MPFLARTLHWDFMGCITILTYCKQGHIDGALPQAICKQYFTSSLWFSRHKRNADDAKQHLSCKQPKHECSHRLINHINTIIMTVVLSQSHPKHLCMYISKTLQYAGWRVALPSKIDEWTLILQQTYNYAQSLLRVKRGNNTENAYRTRHPLQTLI